MKNIYLTGMMGSGKSAVARVLAKKLNRPCMDLDNEMVHETSSTIPDIFRKKGEAYFRQLESGILQSLKADGLIIATGGGSVVSPENRVFMKQTGIVIYLEDDAETLWKRIGKDKNRPLLSSPDPKKVLCDLLESRRSFYEEADYRVHGGEKNPEQVAEELLKTIQFDQILNEKN